MKKPNFFIIGAPKCGTTAMCRYLSQHPNVFIPSIKEPHFFNDDFPQNRHVNSLDDYLKLFNGSDSNHFAIGEGTVIYMYSKAALENIYKFNPNAKIIVMLRNPLHMVVSLHAQFFHALFEDEPEFKKAWDLRSERSQGRSIPKLCRAVEWLDYGWMASYSIHLKNVYKVFPKENVKVIIFDDFTKDTEAIFFDVLDFLGVRRIKGMEYKVVNPQRSFSSNFARVLAQNTPVLIRNMITRMRFSPFLSWFPKLLTYLLKSESKTKSTFANLQDEMLKQYLREYFSSDIEILSQMLGRNLTKLWLEK